MREISENAFDIPVYGLIDAAHYLRVPYQTLRYWVCGRSSIEVEPIINPAASGPPRLSFNNLMECHMLSAMRTQYNLRLPKVRKALKNLKALYPSPHPLIDKKLETDSISVFVRDYANDLINLNQPNQRQFTEIISMYMRRIERDTHGMLVFFPFVEKRAVDEPRLIMITPAISFGRPVISGTGISTAVIASRFHARESVDELAREYGRSNREIEEAIRWESSSIAA